MPESTTTENIDLRTLLITGSRVLGRKECNARLREIPDEDLMKMAKNENHELRNAAFKELGKRPGEEIEKFLLKIAQREFVRWDFPVELFVDIFKKRMKNWPVSALKNAITKTKKRYSSCAKRKITESANFHGLQRVALEEIATHQGEEAEKAIVDIAIYHSNNHVINQGLRQIAAAALEPRMKAWETERIIELSEAAWKARACECQDAVGRVLNERVNKWSTDELMSGLKTYKSVGVRWSIMKELSKRAGREVDEAFISVREHQAPWLQGYREIIKKTLVSRLKKWEVDAVIELYMNSAESSLRKIALMALAPSVGIDRVETFLVSVASMTYESYDREIAPSQLKKRKRKKNKDCIVNTESYNREREIALKALAKVHGKAVDDAFIQTITDVNYELQIFDYELRLFAVKVLAKREGNDIEQALARAVSDQYDKVRNVAIKALKDRGKLDLLTAPLTKDVA